MIEKNRIFKGEDGSVAFERIENRSKTVFTLERGDIPVINKYGLTYKRQIIFFREVWLGSTTTYFIVPAEVIHKSIEKLERDLKDGDRVTIDLKMKTKKKGRNNWIPELPESFQEAYQVYPSSFPFQFDNRNLSVVVRSFKSKYDLEQEVKPWHYVVLSLLPVAVVIDVALFPFSLIYLWVVN